MEVTVIPDSPVTSEVERLRARLAELEQTAARRARELTALHEILLEIGQLTDLTVLLQTIVEKAAGLLNAQMGGLYLFQPETRTLELVVAHHLPGDWAGTVLHEGEGLSGRIAQTGEVMIVSDYHAWEGQAAVYSDALFRRVVGVPLKVGEKIIGVINIIDDQHAGSFDEDEVRLVTLFAEQAAIAVEKAQLLIEVQRELAERQRAEQVQSSLYRISEAIHTAQNLDELYRSIHQIIGDLMPARNFAIALHDAATGSFIFPYRVDEHYPGDLTPPPRPSGSTLVDYVWQTGEPLLATIDQLTQLVAERHLQPVGIMALDWLGVPLKWQDKTIGVMVVQTYTAGERLTAEHQRLLMFVSTQVAMAIQRKRAEQVQQAIYRISEAAQAAVSLDDLYRSIHMIVNELMPARNFYIAQYDEASDLITFPYLVDEYDDASPVRRPGRGLTAYVLRTGQPLFATPEVFEEMVRRGEAELIGGSSVDWLGVPLKVHDKVIGVIAVQSYSEHVRLTEEHRDLLAFVSTQVAMAIQRKRAETALRASEQRYHDLFEAAQRQTQELTLLDRVRTVVTREFNLSELFRAVVTAIAETFGYTLVSLYMLEGQMLRLQHQVGYDIVLEDIPITSSVMGRVARTGQPELVEDVFAEPVFLATMDDIISEVVVPLVDAGKTVGVLNIESTRGFRLTEADLRLMIGLSEHVSSAISRARLYTEARQNAARLTATIESLPFDFWALDQNYRYVLQNSVSVQHWGECLGRHVRELEVSDAVRAHWESNNRRAFAGEVVQDEITYRVDGEQRYFHEVIAPIWSEGEIHGILGVNIDITDRQRAEAELRASEARLRAVTTNVPVMLFALDQYGIFTFAEGQGLDVLGGTAENLIGRSVFEVMHAVPRVVEALRLALDGGALDFVFDINERNLEMWLSPLTTPQGEFNGVIGVAVDMTERERTEEALRRAQRMESLGLLAGGIAHDFNNLLVAILGQTSLALSQLNAQDPARVPIEKAVAASRRAADLTRQLLAYSGRGQFERRSIDMNRLIQENLHLFEVAVPKNVALRSDLSRVLPLIMGDAGQLQQVIMNLIINAAEAIGEKPGVVMVRTQLQHLTAEDTLRWQIGDEALPAGDYVLLTVEDNGQGMDAETLTRIFDPFFSTKFTGRGLGLAAVVGIVRGHGGGLKVTSAPQVGTTFEIILPGGTTEVVEPIVYEAAQGASMTQPLVLVIDDELPVRDAVTDILDLEGLPVLTAPDGHAGIELYRQRQADIGLILLDLSMPGLNGEETFRELRQINARVHVLLSSGYSQDEVTARFAGLNDVGFIQKPYDAEQLVAMIKRYLTQPPTG
jgi:PAS domain S-box-containing protein